MRSEKKIVIPEKILTPEICTVTPFFFVGEIEDGMAEGNSSTEFRETSGDVISGILTENLWISL